MAQCYHFEGVNNPLDKDADGGMTHDNILRPDWHKGKDLPVNHTSNMSTQTEFDKELNRIEREFAKKCRNAVFMSDNGRVLAFEDVHKWHNKAIKAAVDKYVIGEDVLPTNERSVNWTDNNLKAEQRLALWGNK